MKIHRLNPSSVASRFRVPFSTHQVTVSSPVDRLVRRTRESFLAFETRDVVHNLSTSDHLQVMHADSGWHILRNGNVLARCPSLRHASRKVRHATIHSFIASRPDLLWLHAGAVSRSSGAVLFVGDNGAGKSTLVVDLCRRGWSYISDDVVPVNAETGCALPFPLTPGVRTCEESNDIVEGILRNGGKRWSRKPLDQIAPGPSPVEAIVLMEYDRNVSMSIDRTPFRDAEAFLSKRVINHSHEGGSTFDTLTRLACEKPVWHLRHSGEAGISDTVLDALDRSPEALPV